MSTVSLIRDQSICTRRERRYKTNDANLLRCEVALEEGGLRQGSVIDLSTTGMRVVCEGRFDVGQGFSIELTSDRSYGLYRGIVRRVEPWVGGRSVLGCSLTDPIPDLVLQDLAAEAIVDRRGDERIDLLMDAKISWQLNQGDVDAELRDLSNGGLKLFSTSMIPANTRIRVGIEVEGEQLVLQGRPVWHQRLDEGFEVGVAFTDRDAPSLVTKILGAPEEICQALPGKGRIAGRLTWAACAAFLGYLVFTAS